MKEAVIMTVAEDQPAPPANPAVQGPLISDFGALVAVPDLPAKPFAPDSARPAANTVEHFQLKQALQRAKKAGVPMRDVASMVALTYSGK